MLENSSTEKVTTRCLYCITSLVLYKQKLSMTLVFMSPAAVAAINHTLVLYTGWVYWFVPTFSASGWPTMANDQSISLRCICVTPKESVLGERQW